MTIKKVTHKNLHKVQQLIEGVKASDLFYKNTKSETEFIVKDNLSIIAYKDKKPVGCVLVYSGNLIDTIISTEAGIGSKMLEKLPEGHYTVFVHPNNEKSIALFTKFGFEQKENQTLKYGMRTRYVCKHKKGAVKK